MVVSQRKLTKGVPQGSVLGPTRLLFIQLSYPGSLRKHNVTFKLYADDTQFYFSITIIQSTMSKIEEVMTNIKNWVVKRLKLNDDKTECMLFGAKNTLKNYEQFQHIMTGTSNIKIVLVLRNLGVYIDSNLTMKNQISNIVKVCNHHLRNIAFIRKYLDEDTLKMLMHNHVISRLDYYNLIYYRLPNIL